MTDEQEIEDAALIRLFELAHVVVLEIGGKKMILGPDIQADIVRIMRAGLEKP